MREKGGFTLLEVLVALVLIAIMGASVFGWINTSLMGLNRVREYEMYRDATTNALAFMATVNPMARPEGTETSGPYVISWQARPMAPSRDGVGYPHGLGLYQVGLYEARVQIRDNQHEITAFNLRLVGYKQVREVATGL